MLATAWSYDLAVPAMRESKTSYLACERDALSVVNEAWWASMAFLRSSGRVVKSVLQSARFSMCRKAGRSGTYSSRNVLVSISRSVPNEVRVVLRSACSLLVALCGHRRKQMAFEMADPNAARSRICEMARASNSPTWIAPSLVRMGEHTSDTSEHAVEMVGLLMTTLTQARNPYPPPSQTRRIKT